MKILCENNREVRVALTQLEKQGYRWTNGYMPTKLFMDDRAITIQCMDDKQIGIPWNEEGAVRASELYKNLLR